MFLKHKYTKLNIKVRHLSSNLETHTMCSNIQINGYTVSSCSNSSILNLCSHNIKEYGLVERFYFDTVNNIWQSQINNYLLQVINNETWTITNEDGSHVVSTCLQTYGGDISSSNPGDPSYCGEWSGNDELYFEPLDIRLIAYSFVGWTDTCFTIETNFVDYILSFIFIACCLQIIIFLVCPCFNKHHKLCDDKEYEAVTLKTYRNVLKHVHGIDSKTLSTQVQLKRKKQRNVAQTLLEYDIRLRKLVWYNDFRKDYFLFMRMNHPFFAMLYGHNLHPYRLKYRLNTFFVVQMISMANSVSFYIMYSDTHLNTFESEFYNVVGTSMSVTLIQMLLRELSVCQCFDTYKYEKVYSEYYPTKRCCICLSRGIIWSCCCCCGFGYLMMLIMLLVSVSSYFPEVDIGSFVLISFVSQWTSIFISWFIAYIFFMSIYFYNEWYQQNGIKTNKCITLIGVLLYRSSKCLISWLVGLCCCHYIQLYRKTQNVKYRKDKVRNKFMIGNRNGVFAVTWYEYKQHKNMASKNVDIDVEFSQSDFAHTPTRDILSTVKIAYMFNGLNNISTQSSKTVLQPQLDPQLPQAPTPPQLRVQSQSPPMSPSHKQSSAKDKGIVMTPNALIQDIVNQNGRKEEQEMATIMALIASVESASPEVLASVNSPNSVKSHAHISSPSQHSRAQTPLNLELELSPRKHQSSLMLVPVIPVISPTHHQQQSVPSVYSAQLNPQRKQEDKPQQNNDSDKHTDKDIGKHEQRLSVDNYDHGGGDLVVEDFDVNYNADYDADIGVTIEYIDSVKQKNHNDNESNLDIDGNYLDNSCDVEGNNVEGGNYNDNGNDELLEYVPPPVPNVNVDLILSRVTQGLKDNKTGESDHEISISLRFDDYDHAERQENKSQCKTEIIYNDDENQLPEFWEAQQTKTGRIVFINHKTRETTWQDPRPLPVGWRSAKTEQGQTYYIWDELGCIQCVAYNYICVNKHNMLHDIIDMF